MPTVPPPARSVRPPARDEPGWLTRIAGVVGAAAIASAAASFPAALRVSAASGESLVRAWPALALIALLPMILAVVVVRRARDGLRAIAGPNAATKGAALALWLALLFAVLVPYGATLRAKTHHHALAGVTYALGALAVAVALALVCARLSAIVEARADGARRTLSIAMGALAAVVVFVLLFKNAHALEGSSAAGALVDALAFAIAALIGPALARQRAVVLGGPPLAVIIVLAGWSSLGGTLPAAIDERAPAFALALSFVRGR